MWQCHSTKGAQRARGRRKLGLSYKDAGVDIAAGNALVETIKPLAAATQRAGTMDGLGGFGALFDPKAAGFNDPILVAATDGVGTKLKLAFETGNFDTLGIDLVAMCVNDLVVQGAEPLFFLDYLATGHLDPDVAAAVISGIADGCRQAGCALIGGETAEMPGMYGDGEYDLAGFAVGSVKKDKVVDGSKVKVGDVILGMPSSGVHSNGFSLVRRVLAASGTQLTDATPWGGGSFGEVLLAPTEIYVKDVVKLADAGLVHAASHITGEGHPGNIPRVLPKGVTAKLYKDKWDVLPIFKWLQEAGGIEGERRTAAPPRAAGRGGPPCRGG